MMDKSGTFHGERILNRRISTYKNYYQLDALEKVMRRGEATEITQELRRLLLG